MATIQLVPSSYATVNSTGTTNSYISVSSTSTLYNNTDSTSYTTISNTRTSTTAYYIILSGFNFSDVPTGATINSITIKVKAYESGLSTSNSMTLMNGTSTTLSYTASAPTTSVSTITFSSTPDWDTMTGYGSNFGIRIAVTRSSRNTTGYLYLYGTEILVDYTLPHTVTTTLTDGSNATINPEGTTNVGDGSTFSVTIDSETPPTVTDNGVDVSTQVTQQSSSSGSLDATPAAYTTSGSISGTYYTSAVGQGSDTTTTSTNNCYCSTSGSTAYISYTFDLSSIPSNATITAISCTANGHCESTSNSSETASCQLYTSSTAKGSAVSFTSTSNSTITLDCGTWTRTELDSLSLRFTIGYYGGLINGATLTITYVVEIEGIMYVYTITSVTENHTIIITVANSGYYVKVNGAWKKITDIYIKIDDNWVKQSNYDLDQTFNYIYKGTV